VEAKPDEFWKSEDYFEKMVWRCYREQHSFVFRNGDVQGDVTEEAWEKMRIMPGLTGSVADTLSWITTQIISGLET
jgi:hypothetical protein